MRGLVILALLVGCSARATGPYAPTEEGARDTALAQRLSREGADLVRSSPEEAEEVLRRALTADVFYGPAHNNLGVLYLQRDQLYEAANEFEWARKLMPGHPDPRRNLAVTLERAGQVDEAIQAYEAALEVYPGHVPTEAALARLFVRSGREDPRLDGLLRNISLRGETARWREWARAELVGR